ncbi:Gfo/Idh/MocA family protein [Streptomyces triticirhizae]|uniref:Gfo/Idh/MocA family oxidoreductase n=1 Tax=Streptomyces triticirhizae TaxID=2483353 RepID=A0A3M2M833_9ACTN|nr:Gfo/Idh/MocA family oxidoreductase [Streptomyces triticirhizae]RMI45003.1 gfo/Idh/MocA family oxidoreductase [Streptomyces triticirhizae]
MSAGQPPAAGAEAAPVTFRTLPADRPVRLLLVGAGGMGRAWLRAIAAEPEVTLAGVADLDVAQARRSLAAVPGLGEVPVAASLGELADGEGADAVLDVTVPAAHLPVTLEALGRGLPVLGEKPMAATLGEARALVRAAEEAGELFMVSQSRRYDRHLHALRAEAERLGRLGILVQEFFKAPRFGGFRDAMEHPLVLDMAIHSFDAARFVLGADPVAVYCDEYNPAWSWYRGDAAATAIFEMAGDTRYVYTGSWCSDGLETSWNSDWRLSGERGSATWDGENAPRVELADPGNAPEAAANAPAGSGIAGALTEFVTALRTGRVPMGECHDNLLSLAMVHAAIASARDRARVTIAEVLAAATA